MIFYQCQQPGFTPSPQSSVCGEDEWSPNPSQVVCVMITATTVTQTVTPTPPTSTSPGGIVGEYKLVDTVESETLSSTLFCYITGRYVATYHL